MYSVSYYSTKLQISIKNQSGTPTPLTLPIDFESGPYAFTNFDGGTATVIDNPQKSGSNTSDKMARMLRNAGATWAESYLTLNNKIDFTNLGYISMKVYAPKAGIPVLFKLEGDIGPIEVSVKTTVANAWETLTWNFSGKPSNVYNKLVFMFDFGTVGNGTASSTFLFDDIRQVKTITSINDIDQMNINVYPNPFKDEISIDGLQGKSSSIEIYDTVGRMEYKKQLESGQNSIINVSFLKKGVYILRVHQNGKVSNIKILKN